MIVCTNFWCTLSLSATKRDGNSVGIEFDVGEFVAGEGNFEGIGLGEYFWVSGVFLVRTLTVGERSNFVGVELGKPVVDE